MVKYYILLVGGIRDLCPEREEDHQIGCESNGLRIMKFSYGFFFILMLLLAGLLSAGSIISSFTAEPGLNRVELKWVVTAESNLKGYYVLRSLDDTAFEKISPMISSAKDDEASEHTYTYVDATVFKPTGRTFYYKLQIVNKDGSTSEYGHLIISPQISSARETWGSIKAMFR